MLGKFLSYLTAGITLCFNACTFRKGGNFERRYQIIIDVDYHGMFVTLSDFFFIHISYLNSNYRNYQYSS